MDAQIKLATLAEKIRLDVCTLFESESVAVTIIKEILCCSIPLLTCHNNLFLISSAVLFPFLESPFANLHCDTNAYRRYNSNILWSFRMQ